MAGSSITPAPSASRRDRNALACSRARVTTTRRPSKGRRSNHPRSSAATAPTTIADGDSIPAVATAPSVVRTVRCSAVVPDRTAATGVVLASPPACRRAAMSAMWPTPIRITSVPPARASASQSTSLRPFAGSSCPVTIVTCVASPRCVTGMPAYAGAAIALVTPGTTSKSTPAASSASASSPPRPNTNGSPPFNRTMHAPVRPCSTSVALISSWLIVARPGALPTSTSCAPAGARGRSAAVPSRSCTTTSARASSSAPRRVSSPGSPGPAPTR